MRPAGTIARRVALGLVAYGVAAACRTSPPEKPIAALAAGWSPSRTPPTCRSSETGLVEAVATAAVGMAGYECTWWAPADSARAGRLWGTINDGRGPSIVYWDRRTRGADEATHVADSLGRALVARGLVRRDCEAGDVPAGRASGMMWTSARLLVALSRIDPPNAAPPRLTITAVDDSAAFAPILHIACPGVPRVEPPAPRLPGGTTVIRAETTVIVLPAPPPQRR